MTQAKWLEGYSGQTVDELLALVPEYRVDSIVIAFEQAVDQRAAKVGLDALDEAELAVLAIEAYEREVNNGGHHQFFFNTPEFAPAVAKALRGIGCGATADIAQKAVDRLGIAGPVTAAAVTGAIEREGASLVETLVEECDGPFFDGSEPIADRLLDYIRANRGRIHLG
jgi:hypothetical protein